MRLQAYTIENRIQQMELRHEMARVTELLEQLDDGSAMNAGQVNQGRRELERLELQREHLDVQLDIHRIEAELAMEAYGLAAAGVSGARTAP
jgi:ABC-type phosphate transport system auxiliary subunit